MDTHYKTKTPEPAAPPRGWRRLFLWIGRLFRLCLSLAILAGTAMVARYWITNPPTTQRRPPKPEAVLVEVQDVRLGTEQILAPAMGAVVPAAQIQLAARIAGQIVEVSPRFVPGGAFSSGETILAIDRTPYEIAVAQQQGNLTRAETEVQIEMGQQAVAQREYELLMGDVNEEDAALLLRKPQLAAKEAAVAIARAQLEKAQLDLEWTTVAAPFNAIVSMRNAEKGSYVAPGAALATLVKADECWVEALLAPDDLRWLDMPDKEGAHGATARILQQKHQQDGAWRTGTVIQRLPQLEAQGRQARLLIAVKDPFSAPQDQPDLPPLLLDSFVQVLVEGKSINNVARLPRLFIHNGNEVWIMTPDNTLDIRKVDIVWGDQEHVLIAAGLADGEKIVSSNLAAPVQGMLLRTADMKPEKPREAAEEKAS